MYPLVSKLHIPFNVRHRHVIKSKLVGNLACPRSMPVAHVHTYRHSTLTVAVQIASPTL
jgi:hypothetical protein